MQLGVQRRMSCRPLGAADRLGRHRVHRASTTWSRGPKQLGVVGAGRLPGGRHRGADPVTLIDYRWCKRAAVRSTC